jgi:hypothetical protein
VLLRLAKCERGRGRTATQWGRGSRVVATRGTRVVHCGIQPKRWQAMEWPTWDTVLGWLQADLDFGPLTKFEARSKAL